jgi:tetratricopeptide (TPR) repeat protein
MLGRDAELETMRGWRERALAGKRQIVFVTGEPGIGKTTLVQAFLEDAARVPGMLVARGQCLEHYGAGEAYLPVLDGFSRLCRSQNGGEVLALLRQQAPAWLAQIPSLVPPSEREKLQSQVSGSTRERMLREMAETIETLTSRSPLLLVLEDLHWSDYSTLDLISYLSRRQDPARLMVIGTYRPVDVILGDHPLKRIKRELQAHGLCHELPLEYLAEGDVEEYLRARFPGHPLPSRLRRTIYRRTEGNPLFMVNLVEYLIDQKKIIEEKGAWNLAGGLSELEYDVPGNLRQLIFRSSKPSPELFNWLYLLGLLHMFRGKIRPALAIADQVLDLAEGLKDPRLIMEAHRAKGSTLLEMGRCNEALEHVDRASHLYSVNTFPQTLISGRDCKVLSECSAGKALWALGFPDAAMRRMQAGLEFARELAHPQTLAYATHFAAQLHQFRGEPLLAQERAKEGIRVAEEYYLELWVAFGKIALGWANAELGDIQQGIEQMQQGLAAYEATETKVFYPTFLCSLADQLNKAQRVEEGLAVIARALICAEQTEEGYALSELHRIKGELLLNRSDLVHAGKLPGNSFRASNRSEARASFNDALSIAKQQGTRSWELRAALSMHRLDAMLGDPNHTQVAKIYSFFTEGYETADLKEARARLSGASAS